MDLGGMAGMADLEVASSEGGGRFSSCLTSSNIGVGKYEGLPGSSFQKHGRSGEPADYDWRSMKQARSEGMAAAPAKAAPLYPGINSHFLLSDGEQMLSFSSEPKKDEALMLASDLTLPYYHHPPASHSHLRNADLYSGSSDASMHGVLSRVRGPFTPSQWLELEHQALIFKYIATNMPIPASLLIPIRRSINVGLAPFSAGSFGSSALGWGGSFHLGYSGNADPEPGRCRRTDGKKWRCSRDAVVDQKYCERHINRGRHRSRKHVEAHTSRAMKSIAINAPSETGASSNSLSMSQMQAKSLQANVTEPSAPQFSRFSMNKESVNDAPGSESFSTVITMLQKPSGTQFSISKPYNPFEPVTSQADFGLISTDSLLNPLNRSLDNVNVASNSKLNDHHHETNLLHFIDDWQKSQTVTWCGEEKQSDRTQLSVSVQMGSSDLSSSSPNNELSLSSLKLSRDYDHVPVSRRQGMLNEVSQRQADWIPVSWETSAAGPLGEVLTNTNTTRKDLSELGSSSSLKLLNDGCDLGCQLESSPTGVLQKTSLDSLSGSTRSSPVEEKQKAYANSDSLCDDIIGSSFVGPPAIPSL